MQPDELKTRIAAIFDRVTPAENAKAFAAFCGVDYSAVKRWLVRRDARSARSIPPLVLTVLDLKQQNINLRQRIKDAGLATEGE